jgi:glycosyltransferase involved in cell wall biosynthesis
MRISVLIPCYNAGPYIGEALESALGQTRPPHEVIVIDDGSTDDGADVVRGFGARVRYDLQDRRGIAAARNRALAQASGDWIAFLDADDIWPENSLAVRAECVEADPAVDFVFGLTEEFLDFEGVPGRLAPARRPPTAARVAGAALVRKRLFDDHGGFDTSLTLGEMIDWVARITDAGARSVKVDALTLRRRIHGGNTVRREVASQTDYLKVLRASLARRAGPPGTEG